MGGSFFRTLQLMSWDAIGLGHRGSRLGLTYLPGSRIASRLRWVTAANVESGADTSAMMSTVIGEGGGGEGGGGEGGGEGGAQLLLLSQSQ